MAGGKGERLAALTRGRSRPAVPFGGRYRVSDVVLSSIVVRRGGRAHVRDLEDAF